MNDPAESNERSSEPSEVTTQSEGPGCMPAIVAAMALAGIIGFIVCALGTWVLFQKRTELAIRTLEGAYIGQLEQSSIDPQTKAEVMAEIETLIADLRRGKYENWQASGIMQRLQRLPVFQWGELQAVEAFIRNSSDQQWTDQERADGVKQLGRLRRAVELATVTSFDMEEVLKPVRRPAANTFSGSELALPLESEPVREVVQQAKALADRLEIPDQEYSDVQIGPILRREIELGASEGGY